jgi:hypothetical protein
MMNQFFFGFVGMGTRQATLLLFLCYFCSSIQSSDLTAPSIFQVEFTTDVAVGNGKFVVEVQREWAPLGVDHFYTLIQPETSYYDNNAFFRVIDSFVVQVNFE